MSSAEHKAGLFVQMLEGDYRSFTEDRLTQITAACFNQSAAFRQCFLKFSGVSKKIVSARCTARTQISTVGRLDLAIYRSRRIVAIVENKVDAPLHPKQLKNYSSDRELKAAKKIALVKNYFPADGAYGDWEILHWRDFYLALLGMVESQTALSETNRFIIHNFINYLEEANMHVPTTISKEAVSDLAKMLHGIRFAKENKFYGTFTRTPVFETAADWVRMMESVFEESRLVGKLTKAAKKAYRFNPHINHWYDEDKDGHKKYRWVSINAEISFSKPRGKTKSVGLGLFVEDKAKWEVTTFRRRTDSDEVDEKKIVDARSDIELSALTKAVLSAWRRWIS